MKKILRLTLIAVLLSLLLCAVLLSVAASDSVASWNGMPCPTFGDAFGLAADGDIIELLAQPDEPIQINSAVVVKAGDFDFKWFSDKYSATYDAEQKTYTFAVAAPTTSIDWFIGYKNNAAETIWYTAGSTPVYSGARQSGTYTQDDNTFTFVGYVDENGEDAVIPEVIGTEQARYEFHSKYSFDTPRFKVVAPDGTEKLYYVSTDLGSAASAAPSGSTIVLLTDIFKEYQPESAADDVTRGSISVKVHGGKLLNFDFAGHKIISEYKVTMFAAEGKTTELVNGEEVVVRSTLNIYSSKPGAILSLGEKDKNTKGGCVANCSEGAMVNIGDFGEYSGRNLSTYSACAVNVYGASVVNIKGCSMYRMMNDFVGFLYLRSSNSTINLENARIFGVTRDIQIAFGKKDLAVNNTFYAKNTLFATLAMPEQAYGGVFIRYISDGCTARFEGCVFDQIPFSVEYHYKSADPAIPKASVTFDEYCSFDSLPKAVDTTIYKFPSVTSDEIATAPKLINVNKIETDLISYPTYNNGTPHDYTFTPYEDVVGGKCRYTATGYEDRAVEIDWFYGNTTITEWWGKGETPLPHSIGIPKDTEYIKYIVDNPVPVDEYRCFNVKVERKYSLFYNYTLSDKLYINVYIPKIDGVPVSKLISRLSVADKTYDYNAIEGTKTTATVDGKTYYKIVTAYDYSRAPSKLNISFNLVGADLKRTIFTETHTINIVDSMDAIITGNYDARVKAAAENYMYTVANAYIDLKMPVPEAYQAYIDTKLLPKTEEE